MAYGVRYRIEYKDSAGVDKKIDIEEKDYTGARTDVDAGADPLQIEIPEVAVHDPIVAAGCSVSMISATNMMFLGLYSIDPQKIRIRIYAGTSTVPYFTGYGNTEVHGEEYTRLQDYEVTHYFNDGFAALERFKYLDGSGAKYTTLETMWNVLTRIITKMGLPFEFLYFACRHTCDGVTIDSDETLWHNLQIDQLNYYDEQDEPMTYRQVLEALLQPFGLQIRWVDGSLLICEAQMLADANFSAKKFNSTFAYLSTGNLAFNYDISAEEINWDGEDQRHDVIGGYSRQKIRYSPYILDGLLKNTDITNRFKWSGTEAWAADEHGIQRLSGITAVAGFTMGEDVELAGHKAQLWSEEEDIYFQKGGPMTGGTQVLMITTDSFNVGKIDNQRIAITGEVYISSFGYELQEGTNPVIIGWIKIPLTIEVDGKGPFMNNETHEWEWGSGYVLTTAGSAYLEAGEVTLCDRWVSFKTWVPRNIPGGIAVLKMYNPKLYAAENSTEEHWNWDWGKIRYKNIKATVFDVPNGNDINGAQEITNDDQEYKGEINVTFVNEASGITLFHADAKNMTDRGALRLLDKNFTTGWRKTGDSVSYRLVDLLLRAIQSQYQDSLNKLTGTIEAEELMQANGGPGFLFTLQDTDNLGSRKLLFMGGTYNDFYRTLNGTFLEIKQEDLTINIV
jgi:hypothetical protein